jgi:hypothetical protein
MIFMAIYFVRFDAKMGALIAGKLGWESLVFWLLDNLYFVVGYPIIANVADNDEI